MEADEILRKGLKINIFNKKDNKNQILFLFTSIGKMFFDNRNFLEAKKYLRKVYKLDSNYIQGTILLIKTYIALGNKFKALNIIYKTWKYIIIYYITIIINCSNLSNYVSLCSFYCVFSRRNRRLRICDN